MRRSLFQWAGIAGPSLLLASCSSVLGYESDYAIGAGGAVGGEAGRSGQAGQAGQAEQTGGVAGRGGGAGAGASAGSGGTLGGGDAGAFGGSGKGGAAGTGGIAGASGSAGTSGLGGASAGASGVSGGAGNTVGGAGGASGSGGAGGPAQGGSAGAPQAGAAGVAGGMTDGGAAGTGGGGGGAAGEAGGPNPTDCSVIYLSTMGADTFDGCSREKPKRRLIDAVATASSITKEIRLCAGVFPSEGLELGKAISLRGSYDCGTWERPSFTSTTTRTTVTAEAGAKAALVVSGVTVTRAVEIEGLSFVSGDGDATSRGAWITKGAAPTIRDCAITGGRANTTVLGSFGATIDQGGAPRLFRNLIRGGEGTTQANSIASAGLFLASDVGLVDVVENRIEGGKGTIQGTGLPSAGVYVEPLLFGLVGEHALVDNVIVGGEGRDASEKAFLMSTAVYLAPASTDPTNLTIRGGQLLGGKATVSGTAGSERMVATSAACSTAHGTFRVEGARVYGGDAETPDGFAAAFILAGGTSQIVGSLVHGGGALSSTPLTRAFNLNGQGPLCALEVLGSTLLTGQQTGGSTAIYSYGAPKVVLRSNFVIQQSGYAPVLQIDAGCGPLAGSTFEANAFAFTRAGDPLVQINQESCKKTVLSTADLHTTYPGSSGNLRITPTNGVSPDVTAACAGGSACLEKLFVGFDLATFGRSQVLSKTDSELSPRLPALCAVALGGKLLPESPTDLLGKPRPGTRTSMGAFQVGEGICP